MSLLTQFYGGGSSSDLSFLSQGFPLYDTYMPDGSDTRVYYLDNLEGFGSISGNFPDEINSQQSDLKYKVYRRPKRDYTFSRGGAQTIDAVVEELEFRSMLPNSSSTPNHLRFAAGSSLTTFIASQIAATTNGNFEFDQCSNLTDVRIGQITILSGATVDFSGCSLTEDSVSIILSAVALTEGNLNGTLDLSGGSNAAPPSSASSLVTYLQNLSNFTLVTN